MMKRGEVWWVAFDPSVGTEIQKTRPAIIVSHNAANRRLNGVVVVPVTSNVQRVYPGQTVVNVDSRASKARVDQIKAADKSRLKNFICRLTDAEMAQVDEAIKLHLGL